MRTIQIPYQPDAWANLQAAFPVSEKDWEQMMAVLAAMKPALVKCSTDQPKKEDERDDKHTGR